MGRVKERRKFNPSSFSSSQNNVLGPSPVRAVPVGKSVRGFIHCSEAMGFPQMGPCFRDLQGLQVQRPVLRHFFPKGPFQI